MNTTTTAPSGCPFATLSRYGPIAAAQPFCHSLVMLLLSFLRSVKEFFLGPDFEFETFSPPPMWLYKLFHLPLSWTWSPVFEGLEFIPKGVQTRPLLFVSNHQIAVLDIPVFFCEIYLRAGIVIRALGDHTHFLVPFHSRFLKFVGAVDGTAENCRKLLAANQSTLVYPGGGREIMKRSTDKPNELMWKNRIGFAKYAIQNDAIIVPVSGVGLDESLTILYDLPLGYFLRLLGDTRDLSWPIAFTWMPQRLYFRISKPIDTRTYKTESSDPEVLAAAATKLRDAVKQSVETGITELQQRRLKDPNRLLSARFFNWVLGRKPE
eukprot:TRINITY_DN75_c0_g1_i3.p1 TRINITY_DN75_c0_g1~~TRINITY_DN75_c0_g1_i3.p1  ORF type:complete len:322 (+),score=68.34 TRINITY_DN75_c0_g1_i3:55-1020(+)